MTIIEGAPFTGKWTSIGDQRHSADSCVGRIGDDLVIKWSRKRPETRDEMERMCIFRQKSDDLYRLALGEFVVPSLFVAGQELQGRGLEYKPYIIQPFLDCWTGKSIPDELKNSRGLSDQWAILYSRLANLYRIADDVNRSLELRKKFPITLTAGSTRREVQRHKKEESVIKLPRTDNILIEKGHMKLFVCDFGSYLEWEDEMSEAYKKISRKVKARLV